MNPIQARETLRKVINIAERITFREGLTDHDLINLAHESMNYLVTEVMEFQTLEALQRSRMEEAEKLWHKAHPAKKHCIPDLGEVLGWLISEMQINKTMALKLEKCVHDMVKKTED